MALNINKLLLKKGWTGAEVGRLLMASVIDDIKNHGNPDHKPLFTQAQYERMATNLRTERDSITLSAYVALHESTLQLFNKAQGLHQQLWHGYYRRLNAVQNCILATEEQRIKEQHAPLILTARQYEQAKQSVREKKKLQQESFQSLLFSCLTAFLMPPDDMDTPANIDAVMDELAEQPAKLSGNLLEVYNSKERTQPDYYTLPDGRRSDQMTAEEWQAAKDALFMEQHQLTINGRPATLEETREHYKQERKKLYVKTLFAGADAVRSLYAKLTETSLDDYSDADILDAWARAISKDTAGKSALTCSYSLLEAVEEAMAEPPRVEPHYNNAPELTKWDALYECQRYYAGKTPHADKKEGLRAFKKDYPALYAAMESYLKESVPAMRDLKPQQYYKPCVSWGELAELGIAHYRGEVEPFPDEIREEVTGIPQAAGLHHIAILQDDDRASYTEPPSLLSHFSIDELLENPQAAPWRAELQGSIPLMQQAYSYINAFNLAMEMLGEIYDIDGMEAVQQDIIYTLDTRIASLNERTCNLFAQMSGSREEKHRRQAVMLNEFQYIDCRAWKPTQAAVDAFREELEAIGTGKDARAKLNVFQLDAMIQKLAERR